MTDSHHRGSRPLGTAGESPLSYQVSGGERTTLEPIHRGGDLRPLVHDRAFWLIPEGLPQLPSGVVGRSQNAESGAAGLSPSTTLAER